MILKIERLAHNKVLPEYKTDGAAGMDLCAAISEPVTLKPLERKLIPTGLKIELEHGYEAQVRPRSGLSIKHGITSEHLEVGLEATVNHYKENQIINGINVYDFFTGIIENRNTKNLFLSNSK